MGTGDARVELLFYIDQVVHTYMAMKYIFEYEVNTYTCIYV